MAELRRDNTATFHFAEGNVDSAPGPRIAGYYDDPYYSCYRFSLPLSSPVSGDPDVIAERICLIVRCHGRRRRL